MRTNDQSVFEFSMDGKTLAVSVDAVIYLFTVESRVPHPLKLEGHRGNVRNLMWLNKDYLLSFDTMHEIRMWSTETGHCVTRLPLHRYEINFTEICHDPPLLAVVHSGYDRLDIWDLQIKSGQQQNWK